MALLASMAEAEAKKQSLVDIREALQQPDGTSLDQSEQVAETRIETRHARRESLLEYAESISTIDRPPQPPVRSAEVYHPYSLPVLAILAPASILGTLARLGILALVNYDGQSIFPLAYVQAVGCVVMGFGLASKASLGR
jgi:hypothetical protein